MICDLIVGNLSVQQIMSYSKSSLSHYHTSAKKRPISLVIAHTKDLLSLLYFPDAHVCNRSTSKEKKNNIPNERIQNIYICFAIFLVIVYAVRLVSSCFRAHRIALHRITFQCTKYFECIFNCLPRTFCIWMAFMFSLCYSIQLGPEQRNTTTTTTPSQKSLFIYFFIFISEPSYCCVIVCVAFYSIS